jgi:hypothetical protein
MCLLRQEARDRRGQGGWQAPIQRPILVGSLLLDAEIKLR